jgi:Reverse transcriptase (RNA-dependent DNA polymerase)
MVQQYCTTLLHWWWQSARDPCFNNHGVTFVNSHFKIGDLAARALPARPASVQDLFVFDFAAAASSVRKVFPIIFDTGASVSVTPVQEDFIEWFTVDLSTYSLHGLADEFKVSGVGMVQWWIRDDKGKQLKIVTRAYFVPGSSVRLFSPQVFFRQPGITGSFVVDARGCQCTLKTDTVSTITFNMDDNHPLPWILPSTPSQAEQAIDSAFAQLTVVDDRNVNLTPSQKDLLRWHYKLGHFNMSWIQDLMRVPHGREGDRVNQEPIIRSEVPKTSSCPAPLCAACRFAKATRRPTETTTIEKDPEADGTLKTNNLKPGQMVSTDQFVSQVRGRLTHTRGREPSHEQYCGGTVFVDHASGFMFIKNQVSLGAAETIRAKNLFEREARAHGIHVQGYRGDNGVYRSDEWKREIVMKNQQMVYSGVGAHHQNGVAERAIRTISESARAMILHSQIHWKNEVTLDLWPLAVDYAVHIWNNLPRKNGMSPVEMFYGVKKDHSVLGAMRVWGCPVYVLDPTIQDGRKLPRWQPKSRRGQFLGVSKLHASTIGLIRNLRTGNISPQFHVVYDEWFTTVPSDVNEAEIEPPENWHDLLREARELITDEIVEDIPEDVHPDWLSDEELQQRERLVQNRRQQQINLPEIPPEDVVPDEDDDQEIPVAPVVEDVDEDAEAPIDIDEQLGQPEQVFQPRRSQRGQRRNPKYYSRDYVNNLRKLERDFKLINSDDALIATMKSFLCDSDNLQARMMKLIHEEKLDEDGLLDSVHLLAFAARANADDTPNINQALNGPDAEGFYDAMKQEMEQLESMGAWEVVPRSQASSKNILPTTWAFRRKRFPDGRVRKLKARMCVRGDKQIEGVDYFETYAPVVSWTTIRLLLVLSVIADLKTVQVDYTSAFVQADIQEEVYISMPRMFEQAGYVLKLKKSVYGLKQSPLNFFLCLKEALESRGFVQSQLDPCLFSNGSVICLCYVDDCLFFGAQQEMIDSVLEDLQNPKDASLRRMLLQRESDVAGFLGIQMKRQDDGSIELTQTGLIDRILNVLGLEDARTSSIPADTKTLGKSVNSESTKESWSYSSVVGMLMYLCSNSRPDITFAVHQCARFTHCTRRVHEQAVKRIARYLRGTKDKGMIIKPNGDLKLDCYADADFAGLWNSEGATDSSCVKSRTGFVITFGDVPLVWQSKLQTEIALSTLEAEYIALSTSMRTLIPLRALVAEVCNGLQIVRSTESKVSTVFEDNNGCLTLAKAAFPNMTPRTKHIAVKYHWFRSHLKPGEIDAVRIDTKHQKADIFTKGLPTSEFAEKRKMIMGW